MSEKYREYKTLSPPEISKEILDFWNKEKIFEKSIEQRDPSNPFVFYEGPPSANGMPGIHHVMARTIKDIFCRYKTLCGYQVKRKAGWDTHGLPVELAVENELGITKEDIGKKISIDDYNKECRKAVMKYKNVWDELTRKMGYWVDLENPYITYENSYIESVWYLLSKLYEKGLLYKGYSVQPYSPAAGTGLSSHELNLPGCYKMVKDTTVVAQFKIIRDEKSEFLFYGGADKELFLLAWTTTPWTLPSNTALAVGKDIRYVKIKTINQYTKKPITVILANDLMPKYFPELANPVGELVGSDDDGKTFNIEYPKDTWKKEVMEYVSGKSNMPPAIVLNAHKNLSQQKFNTSEEKIDYVNYLKGSELQGIKYEQLLPYQPLDGAEPFRVILGDFVSTDEGTGIVHIAPTFGADDMRVAKQNGISGILVKDENGELTPLVDKRGRFVNEMKDDVWGFSGEYVKEEYLTDEEKEKELQKQIISLKSQIPNLKKYLSVDERIVLKLKLDNKAFKVEKYEHNYPHCWRTDKPVLYYPLDSWFIKTTAAKARMIELNNTINWKPQHTGTGRFGEWLNNLQDWNLSRSRFWGIPLPIWIDFSTKKEICVGSFSDFEKDEFFDVLYKEKIKGKWFYEGKRFDEWVAKLISEDNKTLLEFKDAVRGSSGEFYSQQAFDNYINQSLKLISEDPGNILHNSPYDLLVKYLDKLDLSGFDFHRPYIDKIVFIEEIKLQFPRVYKREPDLIDVWFDSGAMPYAQHNYLGKPNTLPFGEGRGGAAFPADFIAEGVDQTRGWFYTLHAIATLCFDSVAFKNVISNGLVLDKNGNKMSKRLGNAVDPYKIIDKYGADAVRWYLIANSQPWDNLKFDEEGIGEVQKKFFRAFFNTYQFFALYANIDSFKYSEPEAELYHRQEIDQWIISKLNSLIEEVTGHFDTYEPTRAARSIDVFVVEHLSNWYVRLSRRRFWKGEYSHDKIAAYQTLYRCMETVAILASPVAPFFAETIYGDLNRITNHSTHQSVHLCSFPLFNKPEVNKNLEEKMEIAQRITSMVFALRKKVDIKVRQPLNKILLAVPDKSLVAKIETVKQIILNEINVKTLEFVEDASGLVSKKVKPNFKSLGPKYGKKMKQIAGAVNTMRPGDIDKIERENAFSLEIEGETILLTKEDVEIVTQDIKGWQVANEGGMTVALDVTVNQQLKEEGIARELVNRVQNLRKESNFSVIDRITLAIEEKEGLRSAIMNNLNYICTEILATSVEWVKEMNGLASEGGGISSEVELDDKLIIRILIKKV